jgi:integrase/recombinase XerD
MVIRIEQGNGHKDRYVMLSPHLLELLRAWYNAARPQGWLFPGMNPVNPMTARQLRRACDTAAQMAEIFPREYIEMGQGRSALPMTAPSERPKR